MDDVFCNLTTQLHYQCLFQKLLYSITTNDAVQKCLPTCTVESYQHSKTTIKQDLGSNGKIVTLTFQYITTQVAQEILIADSPSTIAALGGLLGLFVGFSCLDISNWTAAIFRKFQECSNKKGGLI